MYMTNIVPSIPWVFWNSMVFVSSQILPRQYVDGRLYVHKLRPKCPHIHKQTPSRHKEIKRVYTCAVKYACVVENKFIRHTVCDQILTNTRNERKLKAFLSENEIKVCSTGLCEWKNPSKAEVFLKKTAEPWGSQTNRTPPCPLHAGVLRFFFKRPFSGKESSQPLFRPNILKLTVEKMVVLFAQSINYSVLH